MIHTYRLERHDSKILGVTSRADLPGFFETLGSPAEAQVYPKGREEMVSPAPEKFASAGQQYDVSFSFITTSSRAERTEATGAEALGVSPRDVEAELPPADAPVITADD